MVEPKFGDRLRGIYASESNPQRDGFYVEAINRPKGQMNPGKGYRITDGEGNFWEYPAGSVVAVPGESPGVAETGEFVSRIDDREYVVVHAIEDGGALTTTTKIPLAEAVAFYDRATSIRIAQASAMICRVLHDHESQFPVERLLPPSTEPSHERLEECLILLDEMLWTDDPPPRDLPDDELRATEPLFWLHRQIDSFMATRALEEDTDG